MRRTLVVMSPFSPRFQFRVACTHIPIGHRLGLSVLVAHRSRTKVEEAVPRSRCTLRLLSSPSWAFLPNDPSLLSMLFLKYSGMGHGLLNSLQEEFVCYGYSSGSESLTSLWNSRQHSGHIQILFQGSKQMSKDLSIVYLRPSDDPIYCTLKSVSLTE
jgi:hypothetical protein